jgi:hypothetical protein
MGYAYPVPCPSTRLIRVLGRRKKRTPTLYAVLSSLPRNARIEKQVLVHSGRFVPSDPESSEEVDDEPAVDKSPEFTQGKVILPRCQDY